MAGKTSGGRLRSDQLAARRVHLRGRRRKYGHPAYNPPAPKKPPSTSPDFPGVNLDKPLVGPLGLTGQPNAGVGVVAMGGELDKIVAIKIAQLLAPEGIKKNPFGSGLFGNKNADVRRWIDEASGATGRGRGRPTSGGHKPTRKKPAPVVTYKSPAMSAGAPPKPKPAKKKPTVTYKRPS